MLVLKYTINALPHFLRKETNMLVVGDIHGNYAKAKSFLEYKPDEEHLFVGDYTDSYHATNDQINETMKLIFESNAICLSGNHDNQYYTNSSVKMRCTGFRPEAYSFVHLVETNKHRIKAAVVRDGYIITHGGVTKALSKQFTDIVELCTWINSEFDSFKDSVIVPTVLSPIFNIGSARGGSDMYSGIFWADYRYDKFDVRFNQVFGHSHSANSKIMGVGKAPHKTHVCVDCPQFYCFNTKTGMMEDFMPEEFKTNHVTREMLERTY